MHSNCLLVPSPLFGTVTLCGSAILSSTHKYASSEIVLILVELVIYLFLLPVLDPVLSHSWWYLFKSPAGDPIFLLHLELAQYRRLNYQSYVLWYI